MLELDEHFYQDSTSCPELLECQLDEGGEVFLESINNMEMYYDLPWAI